MKVQGNRFISPNGDVKCNLNAVVYAINCGADIQYLQLQEIDDLTALMRDELDALSRETVRHVQTILLAYQESIQNIAPLMEKKNG